MSGFKDHEFYHSLDSFLEERTYFFFMNFKPRETYWVVSRDFKAGENRVFQKTLIYECPRRKPGKRSTAGLKYRCSTDWQVLSTAPICKNDHFGDKFCRFYDSWSFSLQAKE